MPDIPGKSGFTVVELSVEEEAHAYAMFQVNEESVLFGVGAAGELTIGHGAGVVFQVGGYSQPLLDHLAERVFLEMEEAVAITGAEIDPAGKIDADADHFPFAFAGSLDELADDIAQAVEGFRVFFRWKGTFSWVRTRLLRKSPAPGLHSNA